MADKKVAEQYYSPPPKLGKWEGFKLFLWNSETSQCLGRTGSSWAKIIFFYIIFYAALAGFFAAMLAVFYQTLDSDKPKWQLDNGLIGSNPGLGFRPMPPEANVESTLIWYERSRPENYKYWVDEINKFLNDYNSGPSRNRVNCTQGTPPPEGKVCAVNLTEFQSCNIKQNFGYPDAKPCIFLKLNKIYNWMPEIYKNASELPAQAPEELRKHISDKDSTFRDLQHNQRQKELNIVWVSCEGENPADAENIISRSYFPDWGFHGHYFPFQNVAGYIPPLVAVQFHVQTGVLINIECKAWARNIHHDRSERRGSVHFELMVD